MSEIATPDADAFAHSERLRALIRDQIAMAGGAIPFSRFMELALYAPGLGYYSAGATKFGAAGDFVTGPELGPLFAECVVEALAPVLRQLGGGSAGLGGSDGSRDHRSQGIATSIAPTRADAGDAEVVKTRFVEIGGGSGAFAEAAIKHLMTLGAMPSCYSILEPSADLRERQRERLQRALAPAVFACVEWLDGPIDTPWNGVLFANEVVDALPTPRFTLRDGEVFEEHVALDGVLRQAQSLPSTRSGDERSGFVREDRPADALLTAAVRHVERALDAPFADGYRSELLPQLPYWLQAVIGRLEAGALLFVDYGHPRREYYHPARRDGTLRAFHRHALVDDLFARVGLQDLTASVDFTALAEAGTGAGFDFAGYCSQASFLIGNDVHQRVRALAARAADEAGRYAVRQQAKQLMLPEAMGERFQAIGFARGVEFGHAFLVGDLSFRL